MYRQCRSTHTLRHTNSEQCYLKNAEIVSRLTYAQLWHPIQAAYLGACQELDLSTLADVRVRVPRRNADLAVAARLVVPPQECAVVVQHYFTEAPGEPQ